MNSSGNFSTLGCGVGCLTVVIGAIVHAVINCILVVLLWNWLMPDLFELPRISAIQAIGISFMLDFLRSSSNTKNQNS
jgi:uncharacterized membrane protein SpoIIM required for sporulation